MPRDILADAPGRGAPRRRPHCDVMQTSDVLSVLAEVSVAFAGFAGIVTAFRRRTPDHWNALDRFRFRFMVEFSLVTLLLSLLPFFVLAFDVADARVWSLCSVPLSLGALVYLLRSAVRVRRLLAAGLAVSRGLAAVSFTVGIGIAVTSALNALQWFAHPAAVYLAGVGGCLFVCSAMFARLLLAGTPSETLDDETRRR